MLRVRDPSRNNEKCFDEKGHSGRNTDDPYLTWIGLVDASTVNPSVKKMMANGKSHAT